MKPWEKYQELEAQRSPKETGPWDKYATGKERGLIDSALETMDRYGGAPLRAAYGKVQDSMLKRGVPLDVVGAAKAAYDQFGEDPEKAPTAAQLVEQNPLGSVLNKQGFKENFATHPTAVGLRGLMAPFTGWDRSGEIVGEVPRVAAETLVAGETDPLSYVPGAVFEKPIAKGFELGGKALAGTGKLGAYLAENTTGIPREVWSNYAKRAKEIGKMAKDYVGESRYMNAYTDFRNQVGEAIAGRKNQLNETIDQGLSGASRRSKISITPIIEELDTSMRGLHPVTEKAAIDEIQALKNKVRELAPEGKMSPWDAYKLQRFFHDRSMKAFSEGGQLFNPSSQAARAAKSARYKTTEMVNQFFPDTIKKANQQFVSLHNIDDMIPPSMLDPNGSAAALRRAALDPNSKERKALSQLSQFLHGDDRLVQQAMDLSTFEKMTNLPINPLSGGGTTSTSRTLLGGGVGLLGEASDDPEAKWLARGAGAMIASPALLKMGLDAGLMAPNAAKKLASKGGLLEKGVEKINPTMRALEKRLEGAGGKAREFIKDEEGSFSPKDLLKILKPGEENVFDLKTARGMAGEPKRGLLEPKGNPPANLVVNKAGFREPTISRTDRTVAKELIKKVEQGAELTEKERAFFTDLEARARSMGAKDFLSELQSDWSKAKANSWAANNEKVTRAYEASKPAEKPRGLLTSLDVERGPVKELPEAGKLVDTVRENRGEQWVAGKRIGGIHKAELGPHAGKEFTLTGKTGEANEASNWNTLHEIKFKDGQSEWLTSDEIFHMTDPDSFRNPYVGRAKVGKYDAGPRSVIVDENGNSWRVAKVDQNSKMVTLNLERGGDLGKNIPNQITVPAKDLEKWETYGEYEGRKYKTWNNQQKAAEAERMKKGLIGVDFGGRGGKMPKAKIKSATAPKISREELAEQGRQWLSELDFGDIEPDELIEQLAKMSDDQILKMVNKHWDGGMRGFEEAMNASLKPAPPKKIGSKPKKKK